MGEVEKHREPWGLFLRTGGAYFPMAKHPGSCKTSIRLSQPNEMRTQSDGYFFIYLSKFNSVFVRVSIIVSRQLPLRSSACSPGACCRQFADQRVGVRRY